MASNDNGGIFFNPEVNATLAVLNSTIYNNAYTFDFGDSCPPLGTCQITYSDNESGRPDSGNIDADPRLVNPDNGEYYLRTDSPCRDKRTPAGAPATDIEGNKGYVAKRQVAVPVETFDYTEPGIEGQRGCRADYEIVAGHRGLLRDSCRGDSGSPLYVEAEDGSYILLGATSRGEWASDYVCGDGGIYVRVDKFLDWIRATPGVTL